MPTGFFRWSRTPATNASATYNMAEGMAPSSVNDGIRGLMSDAAQWRDDISGAITTTGTSTSYDVTSYSSFESLALMSGNLIAFSPHATNTGTTTLNVDGLGAKPLRSAPSVELFAGTLIEGTPYLCLYNNSDAVFYLHGGIGNPNAYSIPLGAGVTYWGSTAPSTNFALAQGQAISRTTYAALYTLIGDTYGAGNGATTFNIPDMVGRTTFMRDGGQARISSTYFGGNPANLGAVCGSQSKALVTQNLPAYTPSGTISNGLISISHNAAAANGSATGGGAFPCGGSTASISASQGTSTFTGSAQGGSSVPFGILPTAIISNHIIRVL